MSPVGSPPPVGPRPAIRRHDLPEDRVVVVAATVVPNDGAHVLRHTGEVAQQGFDRPTAELGVLVDGAVQVCNVRAVVAVVVYLHGLCVDVRLKPIEAVRHRRYPKSHPTNLPKTPNL